mgnify:CR=1 FL=1
MTKPNQQPGSDQKQGPPGRGPGPGLTEFEAVQTFARALNRGDVSLLWPLLADDVRFASQAVFDELEGRERVLGHLQAKIEVTRRRSDARIFAELASTWVFASASGPRPCALLAQGTPDKLVCVAMIDVEDGRIARIDLCHVCPSPLDAQRTGVYPS